MSVSGGSGWGARIWKAALGLFLAAAGSVGCVYLWLVYDAARQMDGWIERPAVIAESGVVKVGEDRFGLPRYRLRVVYRYDVDGKIYLSEAVKRLPIGASSPERLKKWTERFAQGAEQVCYTDPNEPERALLVKDSKAALYSLWFPALFLFGGLGIAVSAARR